MMIFKNTKAVLHDHMIPKVNLVFNEKNRYHI